jgi:hypothetical protein
VQFYAVGPRFLRAPCGLAEVLHGLLDLLAGHGAAWNPVEGIVGVGRAERDLLEVVDPAFVALPSRVAELDDVLAVVRAHLGHDLAPERDALVAVDGRIVGRDAPAHVHRRKRGDDGADPAAGKARLPIDAPLPAGPVIVVETPGDVGPEYPVLDL